MKKNTLIPIIRNSNDPSVFEPCLVPEGFKYVHLINTDGALRIDEGDGSFTKFSFRPDLSGLVRTGGYAPVLQSVEGQVYFVKNATKDVQASFEEAKKR